MAPFLLRHMLYRGLIFVLILAFIFSSWPMPALAEEFRLPAPGNMVQLSPVFNAPVLKGIKVHPDNPFRFDFILDQGDSALPTRGHVPLSRDVSPRSSSRTLAVARTLPTKSTAESESTPGKSPNDLKQEANKLIKYFLASLTIPEKDLWVNLSPYEKNRIIPDAFGRTEMGRDLLAEDYMLKQITSSLIYPEGETGKKFWKKVYAQAAKRFGTTNIPVNTFNKVWIVPEKAVVYENAKAGTAYVVESKLKVMLEEDYLSQTKHSDVGVLPSGFPVSLAKSLAQRGCPSLGHPNIRELDSGTLQNGDCPSNIVSQGTVPILKDSNIHMLGTQMLREIVIPELTKEVNQGKNFAQLRQIYNSLILGYWYKKKIKDSILAAVYENKNKIKGTEYAQSLLPQHQGNRQNDVELIYQSYIKAFKKGVFNYIKEESSLEQASQGKEQGTYPRKYFSGGTVFDNGMMAQAVVEETQWPGQNGEDDSRLAMISMQAEPLPFNGIMENKAMTVEEIYQRLTGGQYRSIRISGNNVEFNVDRMPELGVYIKEPRILGRDEIIQSIDWVERYLNGLVVDFLTFRTPGDVVVIQEEANIVKDEIDHAIKELEQNQNLSAAQRKVLEQRIRDLISSFFDLFDESLSRGLLWVDPKIDGVGIKKDKVKFTDIGTFRRIKDYKNNDEDLRKDIALIHLQVVLMLRMGYQKYIPDLIDEIQKRFDKDMLFQKVKALEDVDFKPQWVEAEGFKQRLEHALNLEPANMAMTAESQYHFNMEAAVNKAMLTDAEKDLLKPRMRGLFDVHAGLNASPQPALPSLFWFNQHIFYPQDDVFGGMKMIRLLGGLLHGLQGMPALSLLPSRIEPEEGAVSNPMPVEASVSETEALQMIDYLIQGGFIEPIERKSLVDAIKGLYGMYHQVYTNQLRARNPFEDATGHRAFGVLGRSQNTDRITRELFAHEIEDALRPYVGAEKTRRQQEIITAKRNDYILEYYSYTRAIYMVLSRVFLQMARTADSSRSFYEVMRDPQFPEIEDNFRLARISGGYVLDEDMEFRHIQDGEVSVAEIDTLLNLDRLTDLLIRKPALIFKLFLLGVNHNAVLSPLILQAMALAEQRIDIRSNANTDALKQISKYFVEILHAKGRISHVLMQMQNAGVLKWVLSSLAGLDNHFAADFHRLTITRHTIFLIHQMEHIRDLIKAGKVSADVLEPIAQMVDEILYTSNISSQRPSFRGGMLSHDAEKEIGYERYDQPHTLGGIYALVPQITALLSDIRSYREEIGATVMYHQELTDRARYTRLGARGAIYYQDLLDFVDMKFDQGSWDLLYLTTIADALSTDPTERASLSFFQRPEFQIVQSYHREMRDYFKLNYAGQQQRLAQWREQAAGQFESYLAALNKTEDIQGNALRALDEFSLPEDQKAAVKEDLNDHFQARFEQYCGLFPLIYLRYADKIYLARQLAVFALHFYAHKKNLEAPQPTAMVGDHHTGFGMMMNVVFIGSAKDPVAIRHAFGVLSGLGINIFNARIKKNVGGISVFGIQGYFFNTGIRRRTIPQIWDNVKRFIKYGDEQERESYAGMEFKDWNDFIPVLYGLVRQDKLRVEDIFRSSGILSFKQFIDDSSEPIEVHFDEDNQFNLSGPDRNGLVYMVAKILREKFHVNIKISPIETVRAGVLDKFEVDIEQDGKYIPLDNLKLRSEIVDYFTALLTFKSISLDELERIVEPPDYKIEEERLAASLGMPFGNKQTETARGIVRHLMDLKSGSVQAGTLPYSSEIARVGRITDDGRLEVKSVKAFVDLVRKIEAREMPDLAMNAPVGISHHHGLADLSWGRQKAKKLSDDVIVEIQKMEGQNRGGRVDFQADRFERGNFETDGWSSYKQILDNLIKKRAMSAPGGLTNIEERIQKIRDALIDRESLLQVRQAAIQNILDGMSQNQFDHFKLLMPYPLSYVRVGAMFFIDADIYDRLSEKLRIALGSNVIIIHDMVHSPIGNETGLINATLATIMSIMKTDVRGKAVLDVGAGDGILALTAAKLGALKFFLIDHEALPLSRAKAQFGLNGFSEEDLIAIHGDLKEGHQEIMDALRAHPVAQEFVLIVNIGFWPDYNVTNAEGINIMADLKRIGYKFSNVVLSGYPRNDSTKFGIQYDIPHLERIGFRFEGYETTVFRGFSAISIKRKDPAMVSIEDETSSIFLDPLGDKVHVHLLGHSIMGMIHHLKEVGSMPPGFTTNRRSITFPLNQVAFDYNGKHYGFGRLKGGTAEGRFPIMQEYKESTQPTMSLVIEKIPDPVEPKEMITLVHRYLPPQGALYLDDVKHEYALAKSIYNAGIATALPIGYGILKGMTLHGRKVGFIIFAQDNDATDRFGSYVDRLFEGAKGSNLNEHQIASIRDGIREAAVLLHQLHGLGFIHTQPLLENFGWSHGHISGIYDFANALKLDTKQMSSQEFQFRVLLDVFRLWASFARRLPNTEDRIKLYRIFSNALVNGYLNVPRGGRWNVTEPGYVQIAADLERNVRGAIQRYLEDHERNFNIDDARGVNLVTSILDASDLTWRRARDGAMNANGRVRDQSKTGGIDLTSHQAYAVQNSGPGFRFHIDPAQLARLQNTPGFAPDILDVETKVNLREFLGLTN